MVHLYFFPKSVFKGMFHLHFTEFRNFWGLKVDKTPIFLESVIMIFLPEERFIFIGMNYVIKVMKASKQLTYFSAIVNP